MRMGISVSGYLMATDEQRSWLRDNYNRLRVYDTTYSAQHNLPRSIKLTTIKPAGSTGLVTGVTPGLHPGFAPYFIRRIRMAADSPIARWCETRQYPIEFEQMADGAMNYSTVVVSFPCTLPPNTVFVRDINAIKQLEYMKTLQHDWSDNAISISVQYNVDELPVIRQWLAEHYTASVKSVSFIQHCGHGFKQAPYEEITEAEYKRICGELSIDDLLPTAPQPVDDEDLLQECEKGVCPLR